MDHVERCCLMATIAHYARDQQIIVDTQTQSSHDDEVVATLCQAICIDGANAR
jgi:hypothetical protein